MIEPCHRINERIFTTYGASYTFQKAFVRVSVCSAGADTIVYDRGLLLLASLV